MRVHRGGIVQRERAEGDPLTVERWDGEGSRHVMLLGSMMQGE